MRITNILSVIAALICVAAPCNQALALSPPAAPFTLWNFLGIPQGFNKLRDGSSNRSGNRPNRERQPPLKALADPANLMSPNPAIAAAAKIKTEEDLAPQKIKALKYLSQIGCGCYPDVKEALMGALDDCTEEVRYQAVLAIEDAASQHCAVCNKNCCCDQEMTLKLSQIAYERNDQGCWIEASERVREAAKRAMRACCPGQGPISPESVAPVTEGIPEGAPTPPAPMPPDGDRGAWRDQAPGSKAVAGTRAHETGSVRIQRDDTAAADDQSDLDVVTVDFGNQPSQGGPAPSPVTATRRSTAPTTNGVPVPAVKQPPSSGTRLGPSSRRAAVQRGLAAPPVVSNKTPSAIPATANAPSRAAATKQQSNEISGWAWPIGVSKPLSDSSSKGQSSSSTSASSSGTVKASFAGP